MGIRVTDEEERRLEQLRGDLRLTSKGQVIRAALDLLERLTIAGAALGLAELQGESWRTVVREVQTGADRHQAENLRRNSVGVEPGAGVSLPDPAPAGPDQDERQLELPEMPVREALS